MLSQRQESSNRHFDDIYSEANELPHGISLDSGLQTFEELYFKESAKSKPSPQIKFNYAWALIRSRNPSDIRKGILFLDGLCEDNYRERDCLYYMSLGYFRLRRLKEAKRCISVLVASDIKYRPALCFADVIQDRISTEYHIGIASVGLASIICIVSYALYKIID